MPLCSVTRLHNLTAPLAAHNLLLHLQELGRSPSPVVRCNILVALSDMVTHFTALVDCHVPRLAACIGDPHPLVSMDMPFDGLLAESVMLLCVQPLKIRSQALALISRLLLKDYFKCRCRGHSSPIPAVAFETCADPLPGPGPNQPPAAERLCQVEGRGAAAAAAAGAGGPLRGGEVWGGCVDNELCSRVPAG